MTDVKIASPSPDDPFDPSQLRLSQDFASQIGVRKHLITVPVRKPGSQVFVRTHPSEEFRLATSILHIKDLDEMYLVSPTIRDEIAHDVVPTLLITTVSRQGNVSLWPIRLPDPDGRHNEWHRSALEVAELAKTQWLKLVSNRALGAYEPFEAQTKIPDPEWPDIALKDLLRIAFKDHYIDSVDHPACRRLRGEE